MGKRSLEFCLSALIGLGFGLMIGKSKCDQLEVECDMLRLRNRCLEGEREALQKACDTLNAENELHMKFLRQGKEES